MSNGDAARAATETAADALAAWLEWLRGPAGAQVVVALAVIVVLSAAVRIGFALAHCALLLLARIWKLLLLGGLVLGALALAGFSTGAPLWWSAASGAASALWERVVAP